MFLKITGGYGPLEEKLLADEYEINSIKYRLSFLTEVSSVRDL